MTEKVAQARNLVSEAVRIIELADYRALATDGPVGHVRDEMSDSEWRMLYLSLRRANQILHGLDEDGIIAKGVGS